MKTTEKTGKVIALLEVTDNEEPVIIFSGGMVIKQSIEELRVMGRNTQGYRLIRLKDGDAIADIAKVVPEEEVVVNSAE